MDNLCYSSLIPSTPVNRLGYNINIERGWCDDRVPEGGLRTTVLRIRPEGESLIGHLPENKNLTLLPQERGN